MNILAELLSSRVRAEVFRLLFGVNESELHGRELARRSRVNESALRQELRKLKRIGLVRARRAGNRVYYRSNTDHPLFSEIHGLVLKTGGLVDVIGEVLTGARIKVAFVFGSVAEGKETASSDVDLMVVGSLGLRELTSLLGRTAEKLEREINPHVLTEVEYQDRIERADHFVTNVLSGPKLFVVGSQDDLEAMGEERLAQA
jgi:DNA-binding transcriptional ArsR family regulator